MVAKDKDAVEDILRIILHDPELVITKLIPQNSIKNLYGKSVRLDALCVTGDERNINVEVQKNDKDNHAKRVRYNASCITANVSEPDCPPESLTRSYNAKTIKQTWGRHIRKPHYATIFYQYFSLQDV